MIQEEKNEDLVYIDQSGMDNRDVYEYGWGLKGQRIYGQRPGKKRERMALLDLWLGLYNRIHFFAFREAETLIGLTYKFCLSPNTQENRENKHDEWLSFREIGCTIYLDW
jgi:hypothetical protein